MMVHRKLAAIGTACLISLTTGSAVATPFTPVLDEFWITKNGATIFSDSFADGVPPPSGPDDSPSNPNPTYNVYGPGGITSEANGKLTMTPALGDPSVITTTYADTSTEIVRRLSTNSLNDNFLGVASSFEIHALYDMSNLPMMSGQSFAVRATDRAPSLGNAGNNTYSLLVGVYAMGAHEGEIGVFLRSFDFTTDSSDVLWSDPLEAILGTGLGDTDQIELILSKDAGSNLLDATYNLYDYNVSMLPIRTASVPDADRGPLYLGEDYIRGAAIVADRVPLPEPASLALMGLGLAGLFFARRQKTPV